MVPRDPEIRRFGLDEGSRGNRNVCIFTWSIQLNFQIFSSYNTSNFPFLPKYVFSLIQVLGRQPYPWFGKYGTSLTTQDSSVPLSQWPRGEKKAAEEGEQAQSMSGTMERVHRLAAPILWQYQFQDHLLASSWVLGHPPAFCSGCKAGEVGKRSAAMQLLHTLDKWEACDDCLLLHLRSFRKI